MDLTAANGLNKHEILIINIQNLINPRPNPVARIRNDLFMVPTAISIFNINMFLITNDFLEKKLYREIECFRKLFDFGSLKIESKESFVHKFWLKN